MSTLFKKIITIAFISFALIFGFSRIAQADSNGSLWKLTTGKLIPVVSSWGLKIPSLGGVGTTCLQADNLGVISATGSGCGGISVTGGQFNVPFLDAGATQLITLDKYFEYKQPWTYLYLKTDNSADTTGALVMEANTGNNIFTSMLKAGINTTYLLANTPFTDGYGATIGSWGSDNNYFWIKYGTGDGDWGKALYQDSGGYIRNPQYPIDGTSGINIDSRDGGIFLGDLLGSGDNLLLQIGFGQIVFGNYSNTSFYLDDAGGQIIYAFNAINKTFFNSGGIQIQPGTSTTGIAQVGGKISANTTTVGNIGTGEDDLMTSVIAANSLSGNTMTIKGRASGTIANSINAKRLRFKFGSTTCMDTGAAGFPISTSIQWVLEFEVIRTGATTQKCNANLSTNNASLASYVGYATPGETLSGAVTVKLTGEAVANNDVVEETLQVYWEPGS